MHRIFLQPPIRIPNKSEYRDTYNSSWEKDICDTIEYLPEEAVAAHFDEFYSSSNLWPPNKAIYADEERSSDSSFQNSHFMHKRKERFFDLLITGTVCRSAPDDYNIQPVVEFLFMQSITLPYKSFDPVSNYAVPDFLTDRYSNPVVIKPVGLDIKDQIFVGTRPSELITNSEIFVFPERFHSLCKSSV